MQKLYKRSQNDGKYKLFYIGLTKVLGLKYRLPVEIIEIKSIAEIITENYDM